MNFKEFKYHKLYMDIAARAASMSYAIRAKVGCVIVRDGNIISMGWNGMPAGMTNNCEYTNNDGELVTRTEVSHAEENAIAKLAKSNQSSLGATAYVTLEPCIHCAKLIYSAGINTVVYSKSYKSSDGIKYLGELGVTVIKMEDV